MNNKSIQSGNIFINSILTTLKHVSKLCFIALAWGFKFAGLFFSKCGDTIEQIIVKSHR